MNVYHLVHPNHESRHYECLPSTWLVLMCMRSCMWTMRWHWDLERTENDTKMLPILSTLLSEFQYCLVGHLNKTKQPFCDECLPSTYMTAHVHEKSHVHHERTLRAGMEEKWHQNDVHPINFWSLRIPTLPCRASQQDKNQTSRAKCAEITQKTQQLVIGYQLISRGSKPPKAKWRRTLVRDIMWCRGEKLFITNTDAAPSSSICCTLP